MDFFSCLTVNYPYNYVLSNCRNFFEIYLTTLELVNFRIHKFINALLLLVVFLFFFFFFFYVYEKSIICLSLRLGKEPAGTTREQVVYAKKLYESAFHPDTGDLQNVFGRMSFQVPGGMLITGAMLQFYK